MSLIPVSKVKKGNFIVYNKKTGESNPSIPNSTIYVVIDEPRNVKAGKHGAAKNIFQMREYFGTRKVEISMTRSEQLWKHHFQPYQGTVMDEINQGKSVLLYVVTIDGPYAGEDFTIEKPANWPKKVLGLDVSFVRFKPVNGKQIFRKLTKTPT